MSEMVDGAAAVDWLLQCPEPAVWRLVRCDLLGQRDARSRETILEGPWMSALLRGQLPDGSFGRDPYTLTGAHWRLVSLVALGIPDGYPPALAALDVVLNWQVSPRRRVTAVNGLPRVHASVAGNVLAVAARLGQAADLRAEQLARWLVSWQWPDGGFNCARQATGYRSSFHESLAAAWGLHEYAAATGAAWAEEAAQRAADLFLDHHVVRAKGTGHIIDPDWTTLHYPPYWHYDVLQALLVLGRLGRFPEPRAAGR